ncbi:hypothetical protein MLP_33050 [Microlunatus phosphovorus NM-1]|uniref:Uncharacterized protein n=2 Tax=Microlunatus phosphovorus TaxID=29405 RepID=F5XM62_MICPN|nr:hypothetical protein MLP_33050 [Microlunatus phosphovorus NM-1]
MIRNLREIAEDEIAIKATQQARPSKRIARLSSPYRYRLTQQLGDVFAAIGLPEEYERRRDELLLQSYKLKESAK